MQHIESKTGKSYKICEMSHEHLVNTVDVFIAKLKAVDKTREHNHRYISDFEYLFDKLSSYVLIALVDEVMNPMQISQLQEIYDRYKKENSRTFYGELEKVSILRGSNLLSS